MMQVYKETKMKITYKDFVAIVELDATIDIHNNNWYKYRITRVEDKIGNIHPNMRDIVRGYNSSHAATLQAATDSACTAFIKACE